MGVTAREALRRGAERLAAAGVPNPRLEARLLLCHAAGLAPEALLRDLDQPVDPAGFDDVFDACLDRRAGREPLALILGRQEFWSLCFAVSPATLVPRADSEAVVEAALAARPDPAAPLRVLDLGTGTGCLLLAVLHERPAAWGVGVDLSPDAARLAARNAGALGLAHRAAFACADWDAPLRGTFDLVLSNPPYVRTEDIAGLMPEVARHEPARALDGGADGLTAYRRILARLPTLLAPDGAAVLELGESQAAAVGALAAAAGLPRQAVRPDLAGVGRALTLYAPGYAPG